MTPEDIYQNETQSDYGITPTVTEDGDLYVEFSENIEINGLGLRVDGIDRFELLLSADLTNFEAYTDNEENTIVSILLQVYLKTSFN